MKVRFVILIMSLLLAPSASTGSAGSDDFNTVVKIIEQFYHVKHQNLPLLARAGIKATRTAAKIRGGEYRRLAEAGSARIAFFEEQEFNSHGQIAGFKSSIQAALASGWSPLVQTMAPKDEEQNYIYVHDAGQKFHVLVVTIERHEATVVQATISPQTLATLMKDPSDMGKALTDEAAMIDP
jgi:hypothetical protein